MFLGHAAKSANSNRQRLDYPPQRLGATGISALHNIVGLGVMFIVVALFYPLVTLVTRLSG